MSGNRLPIVLSLATYENIQIDWSAFEYYTPLKRVFAYVSDHPDERLSLKKAARIAGLERTYFSKYFRDKVGISIKQWFDFVRIHHAAPHLLHSDKSIMEIGLDFDFSDVNTFIRTFRRIAGTTPQRYRTACRRGPKGPA